eukprot:1281650-Amphidinium_carterae.1
MSSLLRQIAEIVTIHDSKRTTNSRPTQNNIDTKNEDETYVLEGPDHSHNLMGAAATMKDINLKGPIENPEATRENVSLLVACS